MSICAGWAGCPEVTDWRALHTCVWLQCVWHKGKIVSTTNSNCCHEEQKLCTLWESDLSRLIGRLRNQEPIQNVGSRCSASYLPLITLKLLSGNKSQRITQEVCHWVCKCEVFKLQSYTYTGVCMCMRVFIFHHESERQEILSGQLCVSINILLLRSFFFFLCPFNILHNILLKLENNIHLLQLTNAINKPL